METDALMVAVVMQRTALANRWQPYQWKPIELSIGIPLQGHTGNTGNTGTSMRCLRSDEADTRWLFGGFDVRLYTDEAEGYFLNIDSSAPCWFIMWRIEEIDGAEIAVPKQVTLSYNEAARLMDGGERVDTLPAPAEIIEHLRRFVEQHYRPEPKKKRRKPSFEGGAGVAQMASEEGKLHGS